MGDGFHNRCFSYVFACLMACFQGLYAGCFIRDNNVRQITVHNFKKLPSLEKVCLLCDSLDDVMRQMFLAAKSGDLQTVQKIIVHDPNQVHVRLPREALTWSGVAPLFVAAAYGRYDIVKMLLAAGAPIDVKLGYDDQRGSKDFPKWGATPFLGAVLGNHCDVARLLLESGADVMQTMGFEGAVALHIAMMVDCSPELLRLLVMYGVPIDNVLTDKEGRFDAPCRGSTPLLVAINRCNRAHVQALVDFGANIEVVCPPIDDDAPETTPLFLAAAHSTVDIVQDLIKAGVNVNKRMILGPWSGGTALHCAAAHGRIETVELLIGSGIDMCVKTVTHKTALDLALEHGHREIAFLINRRRFRHMC